MKKFKNKLVVALSVLTLSLGLSGCGKSDKNNATESATAVTTEAVTDVATEATTEVTTEAVTEATSTNANTAETVYPLEITDSFGDVHNIAEEPDRIISVGPNLTEIIYAIGADDKLVGRTDYCNYPEAVSGVESIGSIQTPDIEKIISLEPDIVFVSTHFDEENTKTLDELGIIVVTLYEEKELTGVYDMITILGEIVNRNKEASDCVAEMKATIEEVETTVSGLEAPTVYYVVGYGEYGDYTAGGDTFTGKMLEMAGGDNIAKDISGWSITLEELIEADPSIIIISDFMKEDFMKSPNYTELTAVKEGNVFVMDTDMLDRQGCRNAQGILELAKIFHPEAFE